MRLRLLKYSIRIWERDRQRLVAMLAELAQVGGSDDLQRIVVYIATTTRQGANH